MHSQMQFAVIEELETSALRSEIWHLSTPVGYQLSFVFFFHTDAAPQFLDWETGLFVLSKKFPVSKERLVLRR